MNDKPTTNEIIFGCFMLVFGIIAGIGIEKQMHLGTCVRYDWKTGYAEGFWITNTVPAALQWAVVNETNAPCVIRSYETLDDNGLRKLIVERSINGAAFQEIFSTGFDCSK